MLKTRGPGQRTQAIYLRRHNKRPEGPLTVLWQFLANTTKSEQSISLLTLAHSASLPVTSAHLRQKTFTQSEPQTSAAELSQHKQKKADYCDTYGQVPDLSPFPLNDKVCRPSVISISLFVVARSNSSSLAPEKVKISSVERSDLMLTIALHCVVATVTGHRQTACYDTCWFVNSKEMYFSNWQALVCQG